MSPDESIRRLEQFRHRMLRELEYQRSVGRLSVDEYDRRSAVARHAASTLDLRQLLDDLTVPAASSPAAAPAPAPAPARMAAVAPAAPRAPAPPVARAPGAPAIRSTHSTLTEGESDFVFALMSGSVREGDWDPPPTVHALAIMAGVKLDFREATFPDETVHVHAYAVMGGISIIVPPDVHVTVRGLGLMGGFSTFRRSSPGPDAPRLHIDGFALMGGVDVKVREPDDDV